MKKQYEKGLQNYVSDAMAIFSGLNDFNGEIKCYLSFNQYNGSGGTVLLAKNVRDLKRQFPSKLQWSEIISFSVQKCKFKTKAAQDEFQTLLLDIVSKHFNIVDVSLEKNVLTNHGNIKLKKLLARNAQFNNRSSKVPYFASFIGGIIGALFYYPLLEILITNAITLLFSYWMLKDAINGKDPKKNNAFLKVILIIPSAILSLTYFPLSLPFVLIFAISGIAINHFRDKLIKASIVQYRLMDAILTEEETDSISHGLDAQKSFAPLFWNKATWKCPKSYYAAHYGLEEDFKRRIRKRP